MISYFFQIFKTLVSTGVDKETWKSIKKSIYDSNAANLRFFSGLMGIGFLVSLILSYFNDFLQGKQTVYIFGLLLSLLFFFASRFIPENKPYFITFFCYLFKAIIYTLGIIIAIQGSNYPAVSFFIFLMQFPLFFIDNPVRLNLFTLLGIILFLVCMYTYKDSTLFYIDLTDVFLFGSIGFIVSSYLNNLKIQSLAQSYYLQVLNYMDSLTGLKNRRSFDKETANIKDFEAIAYFDVNNLKWANDTLGHATGDELLLGTASCLKQSFITDVIYRIGGDEFVVVSKDLKTEFTKKIETFKKSIAKWQGKSIQELSVAVGYECKADYKDLPFHKIAVLADKAMYEDKVLFYESNSRYDCRKRKGAKYGLDDNYKNKA